MGCPQCGNEDWTVSDESPKYGIAFQGCGRCGLVRLCARRKPFEEAMRELVAVTLFLQLPVECDPELIRAQDERNRALIDDRPLTEAEKDYARRMLEMCSDSEEG